MVVLRVLSIALLAAGGLACVSPSDPFGRVEALEEAQKRYTEAIRWGDLERASHYVAPDEREEFLALEDAFQTIRFTDFEIGELSITDDDRERAEVEVTYHGYVLPQYLEKRVRDHQVWVREPGMGNFWTIQPQLALLIDGMGGTSR